MQNSYNATRVLFNPDIVEVNEFIVKNWLSFNIDVDVWFSMLYIMCKNREKGPR